MNKLYQFSVKLLDLGLSYSYNKTFLINLFILAKLECYSDRLVHYLFHMTRRTYTSLYFYNISQDGHLHLFILIYIQLNETRISYLIF